MSSGDGKTTNYIVMAVFFAASVVVLALIFSRFGEAPPVEPQKPHIPEPAPGPKQPEKPLDPSPVQAQVPQEDNQPVPPQPPPAQQQEEQPELKPEVTPEFTSIAPPRLEAIIPMSEQEIKGLVNNLRDSNPFLEADFIRKAGRIADRLKKAGLPAWEALCKAIESEEDDFARGRLNLVLACMRWDFPAYYIWELDQNFVGDLYTTGIPPKGEWYSSLETFFKAEDTAKLIHAFTLNEPHASYYIFNFLEKLSSEALKPLLEALSEEHPYFMFCVRVALMRVAPHVIGELKALSVDKKAEIRSRAIWALGLSGSKDAVLALGRALKDKEPSIRSSAAYMLGMIPDRRSVPPLIAALENEDEETTAFSAQALGIIGDPSGIAALVKYVQQGNEDAKREGASALAGIGEQAVPELLKMLQSEDASMREAAAVGLAESGSTAALEPLLKAASDSSNKVRASVANALGRIGGVDAENALLDYLENKNPELRTAGAYALGEMRSRNSAQALVKLLEDDDARVRMAAISSLCRIGGAQALVALAESLGSPEFAPLAVGGIKEYGRNAGPVLVDTWPKLPPEAKCTVARLLAEMKYTHAVPVLISGLGDRDINVRFCSHKALKIISGHETSYKCDSTDTGRAKGQEEWRKWWEQYKTEKR